MQKKLYHYSQALKYPEQHTASHLTALGSCASELSKLALGKQRELFTRTFDLQMICYPYIGYHLFGESFKRGAFLAMLIDRYRSFDFHYRPEDCDPNSMEELPDHISLILEFVSELNDREEQQILVSDALIPALNAMLGNFGFEDGLIFPIDNASRHPVANHPLEEDMPKDPLHSMPDDHERLDMTGFSLDNTPPDFCDSQAGDSFKSKEIEKWEEQSAKDNEKGVNKSNPYAPVLKALLEDLEKLEAELKGELSHA